MTSATMIPRVPVNPLTRIMAPSFVGGPYTGYPAPIWWFRTIVPKKFKLSYEVSHALSDYHIKLEKVMGKNYDYSQISPKT